MTGIARNRITLLKEQKTILGKREEDYDSMMGGTKLNFPVDMY